MDSNYFELDLQAFNAQVPPYCLHILNHLTHLLYTILLSFHSKNEHIFGFLKTNEKQRKFIQLVQWETIDFI